MEGSNQVQEKPPMNEEAFEREVEAKEARKIRARREREQNRRVWFGLGMFGLVGWSVAIPTLIGIAIGVWIDMTWPSRFSWTLMLLFIGVILGCLNAWFWVQRESRRGGD
jgi:ATP synthase protein I